MNDDVSNYDGMDLAPLLREAFGRVPSTNLESMFGQASSRRYYRLTLDDAQQGEPESVVVMRLPEDATRSDEGGGEEAPEQLPFLSVSALLEARGVRVPHVFADDLSRRAVLLEDLGDESFEDRLLASEKTRWGTLYARAVDRLVDVHERCALEQPGHLVFTRSFDEELLRWELDHFREWGAEVLTGPIERRDELDAAFDMLAAELASHPRGFVHRDYQSRNLMWKADELVLIDFQDAMQGPRCYDLVALLCDSYVDIEHSLQNEMIARYADARGIDREEFASEFWSQALQRKLKDAGRFVFIDRVRGNPSFLRSFPQSMIYVGRALEHTAPKWNVIRDIVEAAVPGFPENANVPDAVS